MHRQYISQNSNFKYSLVARKNPKQIPTKTIQFVLIQNKIQNKIPNFFFQKSKKKIGWVRLRKIGGSRPAGLGGVRECTDST
jgi:superfamily I DNA and RNA helicase